MLRRRQFGTMRFEIGEITKKSKALLLDVRNTIKRVGAETGVDLHDIGLPETISGSDRKLKIVLVGQYSAGKSTIIKLLTGADVKIGAGITTDEVKVYDWNDIDIVDTPGIQTGIREDHDAKTEKAIHEADLLMFVVTNEMFNPTIANYFRKLAYKMGKAKEIILIINKMGRIGNSQNERELLKADIREMLEQPYEGYKILSIDEFRPCFIDAESYNDSLEEKDKDYKADLYELSNYEGFIEALNDFATDKGLIGKLKAPLHQIDDALDSAIRKLQEKYADKPENEGALFLLQQKRNAVLKCRKKCCRAVERVIRKYAADIRELGATFSAIINTELTEEKLNKEKETTENSINNLLVELNYDIEDSISKETGELCEEIKTISNGVFAQQVLDHLNEINTETSKSMKGIVEDVNQGIGKLLNKLADKELLGQLAKLIGYKFKPWGLTKLFNKLKVVSEKWPIIGEIISIILAIIDKYKKEKRLEELRSIREDVRKSFNEAASKLEAFGKNEIEKEIKQVFEQTLSDIDEDLNSVKKEDEKRDSAIKQLDALKKLEDELLHSI